MTKKKKIIISIISVICAIAIGFGAFFGIRAIINNLNPLNNGHNKTARVILLAGQSNAAGCSHNEYLEKNVSAEKYAEYKSGYNNVFINYFATGLNISHEFVPCTIGQGDFNYLFGPEVGMAEKLNAMYPNDTFFIIKYTWSGTALCNLWLSPSSEGETGDLYTSFIDFVKLNLEEIKNKNYKVKLEGMCWMQGESDAVEEVNAIKYQTNLSNFVADIREDLKAYIDTDGLAFVDAYIADYPALWVHHEIVNNAKLAVANMSPMNAVIDTIAEGLSTSNEPEISPDRAHYDALSEIKLGHLFAEKLALFF